MRRAPAGRLARQRRGAADRRRRPAGLDPQILQEEARSLQAGRGRRAAPADGRSAGGGGAGAHLHHHFRRHRLRQNHDAQRALRLHLGEGAPAHHRRRRRIAIAAAACRPHGDAAAQHRRQGRNPPARPGQERAAHAARPHHPRRVPRRGSLRHVAGDEHRPRRLDGHHPRQHAARRHHPPRADDRHGRAADDGRLDPRPDRQRRAAGGAAVAPVRRQAQGHLDRRGHRARRRHHPDAGNLQIRAHRHRCPTAPCRATSRPPACARASSRTSPPRASRFPAATSTRRSRCDDDGKPAYLQPGLHLLSADRPVGGDGGGGGLSAVLQQGLLPQEHQPPPQGDGRQDRPRERAGAAAPRARPHQRRRLPAAADQSQPAGAAVGPEHRLRQADRLSSSSA